MPPAHHPWLMGPHIISPYQSPTMLRPNGGAVLAHPGMSYPMHYHPRQSAYGMPIQDHYPYQPHGPLYGMEGGGLQDGSPSAKRPCIDYQRSEAECRVEEEFLQLVDDLVIVAGGHPGTDPEHEVVDTIISQMRGVAERLDELRQQSRRSQHQTSADEAQRQSRESSQLTAVAGSEVAS